MKRSVFAAALGLTLLSACGSKTDANEKNFGAALSQYFEKKGDLCLGIRRWPVDVSEADRQLQKTLSYGSAGQMAALEAVGLVKGEDIEVAGAGFGANTKTRVRRYVLTDAAKPFTHETEVTRIGLGGSRNEKQNEVCWGKKRLDRVVKWEGPMKLGDYQEAAVTYTYKIEQQANWATKPQVQAAFPAVKAALDAAGTKEARHDVKLTSIGWEAKGLD